MSANTIVLKGSLGRRHEEAKAASGAVIKPGHLLQRNSSNEVLEHSVFGGKAYEIAKEDALQGNSVLDAYVVGEPVLIHRMSASDKVQGRLPANAPAVVINDPLVSNGDGCVVKRMGGSGDVLYTNVAASAALTASSTETAFDKSFTVPANQLQIGDTVRIRGQVIASATNSTDTLTVKVYIGGIAGTLLASSGALDVANSDICVFDVLLTVRTIGATGTFVASGLMTIGVPGTATVKTFAVASTTIDTTATQQIAVSGQWSTTSGSNSCRLDQLLITKDSFYGGGSGGEIVGFADEAVNNSAESDEAFIAFWVA